MTKFNKRVVSTLLVFLCILATLYLCEPQTIAYAISTSEGEILTYISDNTSDKGDIENKMQEKVKNTITTTLTTSEKDIKNATNSAVTIEQVVVSSNLVKSDIASEVVDTALENSNEFSHGFGFKVNAQTILAMSSKEMLKNTFDTAVKNCSQALSSKFFNYGFEYSIDSGVFLNGEIKSEEYAYSIFVDLLKKYSSGTYVARDFIDYKTEKIVDYSKAKGYKEIKQEGTQGVRVSSYLNTFSENGRMKSELLDRYVIEPKNEVIVVGGRESDEARFLKGSLLSFPLGLSNSWFVSSYFGKRSLGFHHGIDFACSENTKIFSAKSGVVENVILNENESNYGKYIIIDHKDGTKTLYAHLNDSAVKKGDNVLQGQFIAMSGNTGFSTGPHLHFEYRIDDIAVNPAKYLGIEEKNNV